MTPLHRIIQCDGRRYSIKLEAVFWDALAELATQRKERLNRLIARLAGERLGEDNLTARLRVYCLTETQRRAGQRELPAGMPGVLAALDGSPSGCAVIDARRMITFLNPAFARWYGQGAQRLVGESLGRHFRLQARRPSEELWHALSRGQAKDERVRLVHIGPGRVLSSPARLASLPGPKRRAPVTLVWLTG